MNFKLLIHNFLKQQNIRNTWDNIKYLIGVPERAERAEERFEEITTEHFLNKEKYINPRKQAQQITSRNTEIYKLKT